MKHKRKNFAYYDITKKDTKEKLIQRKMEGRCLHQPIHDTKEKILHKKETKDDFYKKKKRTPKKTVYERKHLMVMQKKKIDDTKENKRGTIRKKILKNLQKKDKNKRGNHLQQLVFFIVPTVCGYKGKPNKRSINIGI